MADYIFENYSGEQIESLLDMVNSPDPAPAKNSENLISSGAVFDALFKQGVISQTQTWAQAADGGYDYTMSNIVRGAIPKSFIDQWNAACKVTRKNYLGVVTTEVQTYGQFNEQTGYFELNGLTDISYEEALRIYNFVPQGTRDFRRLFYGVRDVRTNLPFSWYGMTDIRLSDLLLDSSLSLLLCYSSVEVFALPIAESDNIIGRYNNVDLILHQTACCRAVLNPVSLINTNAVNSATFQNALSLEDIRLYNIKVSLNFQWSPRLSKDTILYLINNEAATSAIVITLHPTVYAKCISGGEWYDEINAALENHTLVSLASA